MRLVAARPNLSLPVSVSCWISLSRACSLSSTWTARKQQSLLTTITRQCEHSLLELLDSALRQSFHPHLLSPEAAWVKRNVVHIIEVLLNSRGCYSFYTFSKFSRNRQRGFKEKADTTNIYLTTVLIPFKLACILLFTVVAPCAAIFNCFPELEWNSCTSSQELERDLIAS